MELAANLNTKGVEAESSETLASLVPKVLGIGGSGATDPLDPKDVYTNTRPTDWLTMPDVTTNEIYLLFHLAPPNDNHVAFTVTCTGSYKVEYGTVKGGAFVASGSETVASGTAYQGTFYYDDWSDGTSDGKRQVMLRITGTDITKFAPADHAARNYTNFRSWDIVEFKGNLPSGTLINMGNLTLVSALQQLRYFMLEGTNKITNFNLMFGSCYSLRAIPAQDTSNGTNFNSMFYSCHSLTAIPALDTSKVNTATSPFISCYSLKSTTFKGTNTEYPADITLANSSLTATAVVALFNSLPKITTSRAITLSNTPAAKTLTEEQIAIATTKNWTVIL